MNDQQDGVEPAARRDDGAILRFLRWLIEPPDETQPGNVRALRWVLRAVAFCVYGAFVGPSDGTGSGTGGRVRSKPGEKG